MNRSELISQYVRVNRKFEQLYLPKVSKALHFKTQLVINDLKEGGYNKAITNLSTDIGNEKLQDIIRTLYVDVGLRHARLTYRRIQTDITKGFGFNQLWTDFILNYLNQFLIEKITFEVARTTRDALMKVLTAGTISGLGIDDMVNNLENWPFERYQAARIIRTEVNRAANVGATAQESTSEYEQQKTWLSVVDNRTRGQKPDEHANHVELNGVTIDKNDEFVDIRNGDRLQFPGDPKASAASTINCRCQVAYVNKRDANGELVPRRQLTAVTYPGQNYRGQVITVGKNKNHPEMGNEKIKSTLDAFVTALTEPYEEKVQTILEKVSENNSEVLESFTELSDKVKEQNVETSNRFEEVFGRVIKEVKNVKPEVNVEMNQGEVTDAIDKMKNDIVGVFTEGLKELKNEIGKKKTIVSTIDRDSNELIKTITSVTT